MKKHLNCQSLITSVSMGDWGEWTKSINTVHQTVLKWRTKTFEKKKILLDNQYLINKQKIDSVSILMFCCLVPLGMRNSKWLKDYFRENGTCKLSSNPGWNSFQSFCTFGKELNPPMCKWQGSRSSLEK